MDKLLPYLMLMASLLTSQAIVAQRSCAAMHLLDHQIEQDPNRSKALQQIEKHTQRYIEQAIKSNNSIVTIPVVFHVVYNTSTQNVSAAQLQSQLQVLNDDFRRLNSDANNTWSQAADIEIEFCLASVDPNGSPTSGITRTATSTSTFSTNDNVKFSSSGGQDAWPSDQYLNFWVCPLNGFLGYAQFPGGPAATDGVVCDYRYTGTTGTAQAPFDLGRTATHEVGHWLNLRHIWGDGPCGSDDLVADTPTSDAPNYGCAQGHVSCGSVDMVANYMDYSDDGCMNLFTQGQKTRMLALFAPGGARESLLNSAGCGAAQQPTCTDGIQNGSESGVDCGGPDCPPCNTTCTDNEVVISVTFDNYASETSWILSNDSGMTIASGSAYTSSANGTTISETLCLIDDCYTFTISDSYGDGICCSYGNGSYSVSSGSSTLAGGGSFSSSETTTFCLSTSPAPTCDDGIQNGDETGVDCGGVACAPCSVNGCNDNEVIVDITVDSYGTETTWTLVDDSGTTVGSGGPYNGLPSGTVLTDSLCLTDGCYTFTINDSYGDGICCAYGNGSYSVSNGATSLASGGSFGSSEQTTFCVSTAAATCDDGLQNGSETGIDCGGPDCQPCNNSGNQLWGHYFESGWDGWTKGGSDCARISNSTRAAEGNFSIRIRDNSGSASTMTSPSIDLSGYSQVTFEFTFYAFSMEAGEDFFVEYYDGSNWSVIANYARGSDFNNNTFYQVTLDLDGSNYTLASDAAFRMRCDASSNADQVYIDEVTLTYGANARARKGNLLATGRIVTNEALNISVYPNPTSDYATITAEADISSVRLYRIDGSVVRAPVHIDGARAEVNLGNAMPGVILIYVTSENAATTGKVVKQ